MEELSLSPEALKNSTEYLFKLSKEMIQNPKLLPSGGFGTHLNVWDGPLSKCFLMP